MALRVGSPRPDGYHPLASVFCALDLADHVTAQAADELSLTFTGIELEVDDNNLVFAAARALQRATGTDNGAEITVAKSIPVAAGLAGGSADAAGTLVALNELWELGLSRDDLHVVACELGSDVPFSLLGGLAVGTSRGEQLKPVAPGAFQSWVLVTDSTGLSTPEVFRQYDRMRAERHDPAPIDELVAALASPDLTGLAGLLVNDLADPAFVLRPGLRERFDELADVGVATVLSGAGPTIGILCESDSAADVAAGKARNAGLTVLRADGPAAGAHIVRSS